MALKAGEATQGICYQIFYYYGALIGRHPLPFLLLPLLVSATFFAIVVIMIVYPGSAIGSMPFNPDLLELFRYKSPQLNYENAVHSEFKRERDAVNPECIIQLLKRIDVHLQSLDGRNLLNLPDLDYILKGYEAAKNEAAFGANKSMTYHNSLSNFKDNDQLYEMRAYLRRAELGSFVGKGREIEFTYPYMVIDGRVFSLAWNIQEAETRKRADGLRVITGTERLNIFYHASYTAGNATRVAHIRALELSLREWWNAYAAGKDLKAVTLDITRVNEELPKLIFEVLPMLPAALVLLLVCVVAAGCLEPPEGQPHFWLTGLMGLVSVALSLGPTFGFLFLLRVDFNFVCILTPFLALCVGVDDAFLLMAAWRLTWSSSGKLPHRLGQTMGRAGASITLTTLTDLSCVAVGYAFCPLEGFRSFCFYTLVALVSDFLFQITFFAAVLVYFGNPESKPCCRCPSFRLFTKEVIISSNTKSKAGINIFLTNYYIQCITHPATKIIITTSYAFYAVISFWGCLAVVPKMNLATLLLDSSYYNNLFKLYNVDLSAGGMGGAVNPISFVLSRPPDFGDPVQLANKDALAGLGNFENEVEARQADLLSGTHPELYQFPHLEKRWEERGSTLASFLVHNCNASVISNPRRFLIRKWLLQTSFQRPREFSETNELMKRLRRIADHFSQFNASVIGGIASLEADLLGVLAPTLLQTAGCGAITVGIVTALLLLADLRENRFVATLRATVILSSVLLSMEMGVIGFLSLWGIKVDIVSIVCLLMSIGISIDLTAHVSHRFEHSSGEEVEDRLRETLLWVGWPVLQAALSTLAGVLVLAAVPSYVVRVFWRSVAVAVIAGLYHGLLVMPVVYSMFSFNGSQRSKVIRALQ